MGHRVPNLSIADFVEDLVVIFVLFEFCVSRPKEFQHNFQVVVEPLACKLDEGCVTKVISLMFVDGGAPSDAGRGRTTRRNRHKQIQKPI